MITFISKPIVLQMRADWLVIHLPSSVDKVPVLVSFLLECLTISLSSEHPTSD